LLLRTAPEGSSFLDASNEDKERLTEQSERSSPGSLLRLMDLLAKAIVEMRNAPNHRLFLEVALVRAAAPETDPSPSGLLGRIERLERRFGIEGPAGAAAPAATAARPPAPAPHAEVGPPAAQVPAAKAPVKSASPPRQDLPKAQPELQPEAQRPDEEPPVVEQGSPPAVTASGADGVGLGHIRDAWQATLHEVSRQSKRVAAYLHSSRPIRFEEGIVLVQVQAEFHESAMKDQKNSLVLADALFATLGVRPRLAFAHQGATHASMPEPEAAPPAAGNEEPGEDAAPDPIELIKSGLAAEVIEERSADFGSRTN
jgi:DNA polymerase III subunit gamma/tau